MKNTKNLEKVTIKAEYSRYYPDPLNRSTEGDPLHIQHHVLLSRAIDVPDGIPKTPNPRVQAIDKGIYKEVKESLENADDLTFHLKNKGITILAHDVEYSSDKKTASICLEEGVDGIADGAHTYEIIRKAKTEGTCPEGQYVKFEVLTGIPEKMGPDITGGLNTAVQVDDASLLNLKKEFDWVKMTLSKTGYGDLISYKQNEGRDEGRVYDIREILGIMTLFNVNLFPYPKHPKEAYVSKAKCLDLYSEKEENSEKGKNKESFKMLEPILTEILFLHDYVHLQSRVRYNAVKGGKAGSMKGVYAEKKKGHDFIFIDESTLAEYKLEDRQRKLYDGALYPMLGAMRFLVEQKPGDKFYSWKLKSFDAVKKFFDEVAPELVATTYQTSKTYGLKPNPIGKDENHWDNMYKTVALHYLSKYASR